jgi:hypothetical protein
MIDVNEPGITLNNYWAFCDVPGLDTSSLSLVRLIVCFVCTIIAVPLMRKKAVGIFMGSLWVFVVAAVCEAVGQVITLIVWIHTTPPTVPFYAVPWTPQSAAYYALVDASGALSGLLLCLILGHLPMWCAGSVDVADTEKRSAFAGMRGVSAMLGGLDGFLYFFLVPGLFAAADVWAAIFVVRYAAQPGWAFRASALVITIVSLLEMVIVWVCVRTLGVRYIALINLSVAEDGDAMDRIAGRPNRSENAVAFAGARINAVWATSAGVVFLVGVLCWGKWMPGQYGLFFQPLVAMAIALILSLFVRILLGIDRVARPETTSYSSPNMFAGMGRHMMTNSRVTGRWK